MPRQSSITRYEPTTLSQFMTQVATLMDQRPHDDQVGLMLWRGQSRSSWALEPSLQVAWKDNVAGILLAEKSMYSEFDKAAPYLIPTQTSDFWDKLSIAQHFGMMTRLLDWTVNPLMALWFALAADDDEDAAVWFYRPLRNNMATLADREKSPFDIKFTKIFRPITHSTRVAMQAGWHTVHKFEGKKGLRAIDELQTHAPCLAQLVLRRSVRQSVFEQLENTGMNVSNVFGDLPSVCSFINRRHRVKSDPDKILIVEK
jgi:hypothetical protein